MVFSSSVHPVRHEDVKLRPDSNEVVIGRFGPPKNFDRALAKGLNGLNIAGMIRPALPW